MIELVPLGTLELIVGRALRVGSTPAGERLVGLASGGRWVGERLNASVTGIAADWMAIGPDGTGVVDARVMLETDVGALIYMTYAGRTDMSQGFTSPVYTAPMFETADPRYTWLNRVVAVAKGRIEGQALRYEVHEVR